MSEARLRADGTTYLRAGTGPAVVLVHGVGMNADVWAPQIAALSPAFDVVACDMPGHGGSRLPPDPASLADYRAALLGLVDALGLDRVRVVGHSMGALVALDFALAYPERVAGVAALNAVYCRSEAQRAAVMARAAELAGGTKGDTAGALARWFGAPVPAHLAAVAELARTALEKVDQRGYARTYALFARSDAAHEGRLGGLKCPALFMTGRDDPNSTPAMSERMAAEAPQGRAEIVEGEKHMMTLTAPDAVNARLAAFLATTVKEPGNAAAAD